MTEQEKELFKIIDDSFICREDVTDKELLSIAQAIIQRYPQILAEKVWGGEAKFLKALYKNNDTDFVFHNYPSNENKNIEVFIREVVS